MNPMISLIRRSLLAFCVLLLAGCAATTREVRVTTLPPGANVSFVSEDLPAAKHPASRQAPAEARLEFPRNDVVWVAHAEMDNFISAEQMIRLANTEKRGVTEFELHLEPREFVTLNIVEIVLDERQRWRGVVTPTRAFERITEAGGATPSQIVEFGENLGVQGFALSPDGQRIVFAVASLPGDLSRDLGSGALDQSRVLDLPGVNIHAVNIAGGGIQHITTENFRDMFPSFSPDGRFLLFSSNRRRSEKADLLRINVESLAGISNIYIDNREAVALKPTQARDGTIAFSLERDIRRGTTLSEIWTIGGENQYPTMIGEGTHPAISPAGTHVAYVGNDRNLWVMRVDGSQKTQLTYAADRVMESYRENLNTAERRLFDRYERQGFRPVRPYSYPSWSADGRTILYTAMEGNDPTGRPNEDIWSMNLDGSGKRQLTTNGSTDRYPLLSPDNRHVYFLSNRGQRWAIWRIPF